MSRRRCAIRCGSWKAAPPAAPSSRQRWRRELGIAKALLLDIGGTTAKLCFIDDGRPQTARSLEVARIDRFKAGSGLPLRFPVVELCEIGAGGGSIASIDRLGRLKVGPQSAGLRTWARPAMAAAGAPRR